MDTSTTKKTNYVCNVRFDTIYIPLQNNMLDMSIYEGYVVIQNNNMYEYLRRFSCYNVNLHCYCPDNGHGASCTSDDDCTLIPHLYCDVTNSPTCQCTDGYHFLDGACFLGKLMNQLQMDNLLIFCWQSTS